MNIILEQPVEDYGKRSMGVMIGFRKSMGLEKTRHIHRVIIHPTNPDIVYVAALGHPYGDNAERGLYKSIDGGKNWRDLGLKETQAISRIRVHPTNPDIVYVAAIGSPLWGE